MYVLYVCITNIYFKKIKQITKYANIDIFIHSLQLFSFMQLLLKLKVQIVLLLTTNINHKYNYLFCSFLSSYSTLICFVSFTNNYNHSCIFYFICSNNIIFFLISCILFKYINAFNLMSFKHL